MMEVTITEAELKLIRLYLPKITGIKQAAKEARCCTNAIYRVLNQDFQNDQIIEACLKVIKETSEERIRFANSIMEVLDKQKAQRV